MMRTSPTISEPAYLILSARLLIRCPQISDAAMLDLSIRQNLDHLLPWIIWAKGEPASMEERMEFLRQTRDHFDQRTDYGYLVFDPAETRVLGGSGLSTRRGKDIREIGYWIHKDHINQGYATEVAGSLTRVAFEIDHVHRVEIRCNPKNARSAAIPVKLGFTHETTLHGEDVDIDGHPRDTMVWRLVENDYAASPASRIEIEAYDALGRRIF